MIWTMIITTFFSINVFAEEPESPRIMHAYCACEVYNTDMVPIKPGQQAAANPFMGMMGSNLPYFSAQGTWTIQDQDCDIDSNGEPNTACGNAKFRAEMRAIGSCWELARRYNPGVMRFHSLGQLVPNSCVYSIEE